MKYYRLRRNDTKADTHAAPPHPKAPADLPAGVATAQSVTAGVPVRCGVAAEPPREAGGTDADRGYSYPESTANRRLTKKEIQPLAILAERAFQRFLETDPDWLGDIGLKRTEAAAQWRHSQCRAATRGHAAGEVGGISQALRAHYRTLEAHFAALAGEDVRSFRSSMTTGRAPFRAGADGDTHEDIEGVRAIVRETMAKTKLGMGYVKAVIKGKFGAEVIEQLTHKQLWQLVYTLRNRAAARDHAGDPANRNKSQRRSKTQKP